MGRSVCLYKKSKKPHLNWLSVEITQVSSGYHYYISLSDYLHYMSPVKAENYPDNEQFV